MTEQPRSEFQCPTCGFWGCKASLIRRTEPEYNHAKALEFGGEPLDWKETHKCPHDGTVFEFSNSNC